VWDEQAAGHVLLQHCMHLEILDPQGFRVPLGVRGEITVTGGFNFCLPLLRYRTGDYAALERQNNELVLKDFQGRPPVRFFGRNGLCWNNVDITHALASFGLRQFTLHQATTGALTLRCSVAKDGTERLRRALFELFGQEQPLEVKVVDVFEDKVVQYTSDYDTSLHEHSGQVP
jgi:phenylacetate-CoA ligase